MLIEVKKKGASLDHEAIPQAESYSLILNVPFFCVTDGSSFQFYSTGNSQGKSIPLQNFPPKPSSEYLKTGVEYISFPPQIDNLIDLFFIGLKNESKFLEDTKWHDDASKQLFNKVFKQIDSISPHKLKNALRDNVMMKPPNRNKLFKQIDNDFNKFKKVLKFIRDFKGEPVININQMLDRKGDLYLRGGWYFLYHSASCRRASK
ncbi:MAG: type I restriction enzyme HsdR N-terminal domain-containing protein [Candidatus Marinimicrobia bacterium]|nr:type I restriction enzyme HsdR N-terminal domain-containing protein [Candidatus Neomarinimicrobiota bacterium]